MKRLYKKIKQNIAFFGKKVSNKKSSLPQQTSEKKVEEATQYVGQRFGRALVRLSDR